MPDNRLHDHIGNGFNRCSKNLGRFRRCRWSMIGFPGLTSTRHLCDIAGRGALVDWRLIRCRDGDRGDLLVVQSTTGVIDSSIRNPVPTCRIRKSHFTRNEYSSN
jgi:hypothetical protein